jgi:hypothetical protein
MINLFLAKKRKYIGTKRCRKISNRCTSVTGSNVEFFFEAKKKTIIMKMRVYGIDMRKLSNESHLTLINVGG